LWCWGQNWFGQLGIGTTPTTSPIPLQVGTAATWAWVVGGGNSTCAGRRDHSLWCWGENEAGKSTLLAFLRAMLFGFPKKSTSARQYPPLRGGGHGGRIVVTDDGVCHPFDGVSHTWGRGVKLGTDVEDTGLIGGRLFAFLKNATLNVFGVSGDTRFALLERHALRHRADEVVGLLEGDVVLLTRGKATRGDTISIFDAGGRAVKFRRALPGKVSAACSDGSSLLMQFEEGTLVRVVRGPLNNLDVTEAGYLPFRARTLKSAPHGFLAVGGSGAFAVGSIGSVSPGSGGAVEVTVKVQ